MEHRMPAPWLRGRCVAASRVGGAIALSLALALAGCDDSAGALAPGPAGGCPLVGANLVENGDFEAPVVTGAEYFSYAAGDSIAGWYVEEGAVDLVTPATWRAAGGDQSLDLDGSCGQGTIAQTLRADSAAAYDFCFALSGNPHGAPEEKRLEVWWGNELVDTLTVSTAGFVRPRIPWTFHRYSVVARSGAVRLRFRSLTPGCYGPAIDRVVVQRAATALP